MSRERLQYIEGCFNTPNNKKRHDSLSQLSHLVMSAVRCPCSSVQANELMEQRFLDVSPNVGSTRWAQKPVMNGITPISRAITPVTHL